MTWYYNNQEFTESQAEGYTGFVYLITNLTNNMEYIGKKLFTFSKKLYRKKRNKNLQVASDWQQYYGSNKVLMEEVAKLGPDKFRREILRLCKSKSEANYYELKEQVVRDVLFYPDKYYNAYIGTRISRQQVGSLCQKSALKT